MRKLKVWLFAALILLIGVGLRIWNLAAESPDFEEMAASLIASQKAGGFIHTRGLNFCPPLYYAILHPLMSIGNALWLLRLPSAIAGALACMVAYLVARSLFGDRHAFIAGLLLAVNPLHVFYSQEMQPAALFTLAALMAFYCLIRSAETNRTRDWVAYDLMCILMFYLHQAAFFVVLSFLLLHISKALFFRNPGEQRKIRKIRQLGVVLYNYVIITAFALPWLFLMPATFPWLVTKPTAIDLVQVYSQYLTTGMLDPTPAFGFWVTVILFALLVPPFVKVMREMDFRTFAALGALILPALLYFAHSHIERPRFIASHAATIIVPFFALALGVLLGKCNIYIRSVLFGLFLALFATASVMQAKLPQKTPWDEVAGIVAQSAKPNDILVYWPDFAIETGRYYFGNKYQLVAATDVFEKWAEFPRNQQVFFMVCQFPMRTSHIFTFPGALRQYSKSEILWNNRLNTLIKARDLNKVALSLWYRDPETLSIVDAPSTETQFMFTPSDPVFRDEQQYHVREPEFGYGLDGRRVVWTKSERTNLKLPVTLSPGNYVLRLHCSPNFEQPEYNRSYQRSLNLQIWIGEERKKIKLDKELTVKLPFTTDIELRQLPVHIDISPELNVPDPKGGTFGLKIFSIAVDQAGAASTGQ